ncbi:MAG: hypothetical protein IJZ36_04350 [Bacilli bacterium]|nr:hypothetical protein [Bacilli bacterium]
MRKIKLLILLSIILIPNVKAASGEVVIKGTNTVKVGYTTKIYIALNASNPIEGVDVTYQATGNISVTNVQIADGLSKMGQSGNRYILYASNPLNSGSSILILTIKGTSVGNGIIKVTNMEATIGKTTVNAGVKSYNIKVNPAKTQEEIEKEEKEKQEALEQLKKEEQEKQNNIKNATILVESAEKSLNEQDYKDALQKVNSLHECSEKNTLKSRLDEVRFKIAVDKECSLNQPIQCDEPEIIDNSKPWIILSIILLAFLIIESAYLIYRLSRKDS